MTISLFFRSFTNKMQSYLRSGKGDSVSVKSLIAEVGRGFGGTVGGGAIFVFEPESFSVSLTNKQIQFPKLFSSDWRTSLNNPSTVERTTRAKKVFKKW